MKTALQELIEFIELNIDDNDFIKHQVLEEADKSLKKEKEQIVDAYRIASINNSPNDDIQNIRPEYWQVNAEMWYDKHYNQNNNL